MAKFIFITGGVVSSLGKGLAAASLGALLQARGYKIRLRKLDPYLNIDPGTMSPIQHGEVFVTEDGAETDLDLGHYERFTSVNAKGTDNITTGKIYANLLMKERRGDYLGHTVQVIPHVTDLIKQFILNESENSDFVLCEIGGTVGDIEGQPFFETIRQLGNELGKDRALFIHLTLVPYIPAARELKTKPTQHSVKELRSIGIQPDILLCRADREIPADQLRKIAAFCNVKPEAVIPALDVKNIYQAPILYHEKHLDEVVITSFGMDAKKTTPDLTKWHEIIEKLENPKGEVTIAIVGKYTSLRDAYKSVSESLSHAAISMNLKLKIKWVNSRRINAENIHEKLENVDGILVPGGFGLDGINGKVLTIKYARENKIPFFGICLGMQLSLIEIATNVCDLENASSTEFGKCKNPVIALMTEWQSKDTTHKRSEDGDLGGTMRLGNYPCRLDKSSISYKKYGSIDITERHRHRYEVNLDYKSQLENAGVKFVGMSPDNQLTEIIELKDHPYFVAVQFHPEFKSRPFEPHPLFLGLVEAAYKRK